MKCLKGIESDFLHVISTCQNKGAEDAIKKHDNQETLWSHGTQCLFDGHFVFSVIEISLNIWKYLMSMTRTEVSKQYIYVHRVFFLNILMFVDKTLKSTF